LNLDSGGIISRWLGRDILSQGLPGGALMQINDAYRRKIQSSNVRMTLSMRHVTKGK
jgi:hypothetical protein